MAKLAVWVEGDRDRRLFETVILPRLLPTYEQALVREYRQRKRPDFNRLLRVLSHQDFDRLLVADRNASPCVMKRKEKLRESYPDLANHEILVVSKEIESWYLAGLTAEGAAALKVTCPASTDHLTKEDLNRLRPSRFDSELDFLVELLKHFDVATACGRNQSFAYFCRKYLR